MPEQFPTPPTEKPTQSDESKTMQQLGEIAMSEATDSMSADAAHEAMMMGHQANEAESQRIQREFSEKQTGPETKE